MKILVIQQKMIGDVLTSSIICKNLKEHFPNAIIDYCINSHTYPVVENNPYIDNFIFFTPEYRNKKSALIVFLKEIKQRKYDVVIDAYGKLESNLISIFSGAPIKIAYFKWYTSFIYSHSVKRLNKTDSNNGLAIENRLLLLKEVIKETSDFKFNPKIFLTDSEIEKASKFLKSNNIDAGSSIIMIGILGSGNKKTYPPIYMAKVLDEIVNFTDAVLLFNYIPSQVDEAKIIYDLCSSVTRERIKFDVFANSLRDFLAVLYHCKCLIGNEGGTTNMAKALNIPTFSIFAPWISKESWDLFSSKENVSVHLKDYKPQLFDSKSNKQIKKEVLKFYNHFPPNLFRESLKSFLEFLK